MIESDMTKHSAVAAYSDPRLKNTSFDGRSPAVFLEAYADALTSCLKAVDTDALAEAVEAIKASATKGGTVYLVGNGGSAAICDHFVCDFIKGTFHADHPTVRAISLTENVALYSAVANDLAFEDVFAFQLKMRLKAQDVLIAVSSSGNSGNILRAVAVAKSVGARSVGLSGFTGGRLKDDADIALYLPFDNYGVVEDGHSALLHVIAQLIANNRDGR